MCPWAGDYNARECNFDFFFHIAYTAQRVIVCRVEREMMLCYIKKYIRRKLGLIRSHYSLVLEPACHFKDSDLLPH